MQYKRKKKILYVITKSNFGGAQRYVYELATSLPKDTYEVIVAFGGSGILKGKLEAAGIRTREIKSFQRDIALTKEIRSLRELWQLYREEKPDIVHLNSSKAGGSGAFVARILGIKNIIYTAHGWAFWEKRPFLWRALVWTASWATALLCHKIILVSEYEYKHTHLPFVRHKFSVIHTAVPHIDFKNRENARETLFRKTLREHHENSLWLVTIAELTHNKNLTASIEAVANYNVTHSRKIFYTIIGDGELHDKLSAHILEKGAQDFVVLLGNIDNARTYLHAFDAFLLPSKKEGLPYAILEAGAAGLSVITSRVGGIPEIIEHEKNGLLIDPFDISDITHALKLLAESRDYRTTLGTKLQQKIAEEFTLSKMTASTILQYHH